VIADPQARDWEGHAWSDWHQLDEAVLASAAIAPDEAGIYRIRCRGEEGLVYVGETGKSIRGRFRQLRKATEYVAAGKRPGPPHVAGGCVLEHERRGSVVEVSWFTTRGVDGRDRKGIECELIAAYRKATGLNPTCQFGGMPEHEVD